MLCGNEKNSRGNLLLSTRPHPVFLANSHGIVMFSKIYGIFVNDVKKCVCVLIIDLCIKCSKNNMASFLGGILCTSAYGCIFLCIVVKDCI